jgi:hypothetical protein
LGSVSSEDKASINGSADSSYSHRLLGGIINSGVSCIDEYGMLTFIE